MRETFNKFKSFFEKAYISQRYYDKFTNTTNMKGRKLRKCQKTKEIRSEWKYFSTFPNLKFVLFSLHYVCSFVSFSMWPCSAKGTVMLTIYLKEKLIKHILGVMVKKKDIV